MCYSVSVLGAGTLGHRGGGGIPAWPFSPGRGVAWGSKVTSRGTGAGRRDLQVPPAPLPAASASSCDPVGERGDQGLPGPAPRQPQLQPSFPGPPWAGGPAQVSPHPSVLTPSTPSGHPPRSGPEIAAQLCRRPGSQAAPSRKNDIPARPARLRLPLGDHPVSVGREGQLGPVISSKNTQRRPSLWLHRFRPLGRWGSSGLGAGPERVSWSPGQASLHTPNRPPHVGPSLQQS